jgi:hypothetical protein
MSDILCLENPQQQSVLNRVSKDKFLLAFNLPSFLKEQTKQDKNLDINTVQMSIYGSVVPQIQVPSVEVPFAGQVYNTTTYTRPNYPPLTVSFVIDNKFLNYWLFWRWLAFLNGPRTSLYEGNDSDTERRNKTNLAGFNTEFQTQLSIYGLNEYNQKSIEFIYYNAFITTLAGIDYNYREPEILESVATFQYSQFDIRLLND